MVAYYFSALPEQTMNTESNFDAASTKLKMYQPPQESNSLLDDSTVDMTNSHLKQLEEKQRQRHSGAPSWMSHFKSHSHAAPFSYEYVVEDGKMPFLSEIHPVKRKDLPSMLGAPAMPSMTKSEEERMENAGLMNTDEHSSKDPLFDYLESTADMVKRAFSLSGSTRSGHQRSMSSQLPQRANTEPKRLQSPAISPPPLVAPKLILPTPSPSPELIPTPQFRNSAASSLRSATNHSAPRSSWTTYSAEDEEEDRFDLALLQETAMGRLDPAPVPTPTYEFRRNKAFALLGITEMPLTPPYTPAVSVAPSVSDYHSRMNSRRASVEHSRHSNYTHSRRGSSISPKFARMEPAHVPAGTPSPPVTPGEQQHIGEDFLKTPKPPARSERRPVMVFQDQDIEATPRQPAHTGTFSAATTTITHDLPTPVSPTRPELKRKQSKFIEHLESSPKSPSETIFMMAPSPNHPTVVAPMTFDPETPPPGIALPLSSPLGIHTPPNEEEEKPSRASGLGSQGLLLGPAPAVSSSWTTTSPPRTSATITAAEGPLPLSADEPLDASVLSWPLTAALPTAVPAPVPASVPYSKREETQPSTQTSLLQKVDIPPPVPPKIPLLSAPAPIPSPVPSPTRASTLAIPVPYNTRANISRDDIDAITPCEVQYPDHMMPRRSKSLRESTASLAARRSWGAVVCTAEVKPIVAMGSAKLVSSTFN